jgi:hypothetical protein
MIKKVIYSIYLCSIVISCNTNKDFKLSDSNCIIEKDSVNTLIESYNIRYRNHSNDTNYNRKAMALQFFNNPYHIDSSTHLIVILCNEIVYDSKFQKNINLNLPIDVNNKPCEIELLLKNQNVLYLFKTMQVGVIEEKDDLVQIVFLPKENDWFTFYFSFSKSGKYQESP